MLAQSCSYWLTFSGRLFIQSSTLKGCVPVKVNGAPSVAAAMPVFPSNASAVSGSPAIAPGTTVVAPESTRSLPRPVSSAMREPFGCPMRQ